LHFSKQHKAQVLHFFCKERIKHSCCLAIRGSQIMPTQKNVKLSKISPEGKRGDVDPDDIRYKRTRKRLARAILSLAGERDINSASISELTRRAGVYRTTFYAHANTPVDLLTEVLTDELDEVRQRYMMGVEGAGQLLRDFNRRCLREFIDHILKHEAVYGGHDRASSMFVLRTVLAERVKEAVFTSIRRGFVTPPTSSPEDAAVYSGFLGQGIAGAVEAWLRLPAPRDREALLMAIESTFPPWYAPAAPRRKPAKRNTLHAVEVAKRPKARPKQVKGEAHESAERKRVRRSSSNGR
jgi:AcrR family transcriptional regulator